MSKNLSSLLKDGNFPSFSLDFIPDNLKKNVTLEHTSCVQNICITANQKTRDGTISEGKYPICKICNM